MKNPFTNAKLVGHDTHPAVYHNSQHRRGSKEFVMSRSELKIFAACPHKWVAGWRQDSSDATEWGTLCDILLLQPHNADGFFAVQPDTYTNDKGEEKPWSNNANVCKEWNQEQQDNGMVVVKPGVYNDATEAIKILMDDPRNAEYVKCSQCQVLCTAEYHDEETGIIVPVKAMIDLVPDKAHQEYGNTLADFKTTTNAAHQVWSREIHKWSYHMQAAMYLDIYNAATGDHRNEFRHLIQESEPPFEVGRRKMYDDPDDLTSFIAIGRIACIEMLKAYCQCLIRNEWPSYDTYADGWTPVEPEAWMVK